MSQSQRYCPTRGIEGAGAGPLPPERIGESMARLCHWAADIWGEIRHLAHDCQVVGEIEIAEDWLFCPYCGRGLKRAIKTAQRDKGAEQKRLRIARAEAQRQRELKAMRQADNEAEKIGALRGDINDLAAWLRGEATLDELAQKERENGI